MKHMFDVEIAQEYGIIEAVLLEYIGFWVVKNEANETNYHEGKYWTYNSSKALSTLYPYASERKIRYAIEKLKEEGIILTSNFNESKLDRTLWYTLTEKGRNLLKLPIRQNCQTDSVKMSDGIGKNVGRSRQNCKTNTSYKTQLKDTVRRHISSEAEDKDTLDKVLSDAPTEMRDVLEGFIEMRKVTLRKPLTPRALRSAIKKAVALTNGTVEECIKVFEQSIENGWASVYELKNAKKKGDRLSDIDNW